MYSDIKLLHITLVCISFSFFLLRGYWMLTAADKLNRAWVKRSPHTIDTLLLASGVGLIIVSGITPSNSPWLTTKLCLLLGYIVFGAFGLRYAPTRQRRIGHCTAAIICFLSMAYLALHKPF